MKSQFLALTLALLGPLQANAWCGHWWTGYGSDICNARAEDEREQKRIEEIDARHKKDQEWLEKNPYKNETISESDAEKVVNQTIQPTLSIARTEVGQSRDGEFAKSAKVIAQSYWEKKISHKQCETVKAEKQAKYGIEPMTKAETSIIDLPEGTVFRLKKEFRVDIVDGRHTDRFISGLGLVTQAAEFNTEHSHLDNFHLLKALLLPANNGYLGGPFVYNANYELRLVGVKKIAMADTFSDCVPFGYELYFADQDTDNQGSVIDVDIRRIEINPPSNLFDVSTEQLESLIGEYFEIITP